MDLTRSLETVFPESIRSRFEIREARNAASVLQAGAPSEFEDIVDVLSHFESAEEDITVPGGNRSLLARRVDDAFRDRGWREAQFEERIILSRHLSANKERGEEAETSETEVVSEGYRLDNVKGSVAVDTEWNAKDGI